MSKDIAGIYNENPAEPLNPDHLYLKLVSLEELIKLDTKNAEKYKTPHEVDGIVGVLIVVDHSGNPVGGNCPIQSFHTHYLTKQLFILNMEDTCPEANIARSSLQHGDITTVTVAQAKSETRHRSSMSSLLSDLLS